MKTRILGVITALLFIVTMWATCHRVDAGHVGLKVNMVGGDRGVSKTEYVTGWVFANPFTQKVFEFPIYQQHKEYDEFTVPSKGGTVFKIHPSFNYNLEPGKVAEMFQTFRLNLDQLEEGYLKNALFVSVREVTNTFTVDSILNNQNIYDASILKALNTKLAPYFLVTTFTTGLEPDDKLKAVISAKAQAIQEALQLENEQKKIRVQAENDVIAAKRDSSVLVINAKAEAEAIHQKQVSLTPEYIEFIKAQKWDGKYPSTMAGGSGLLMQLPK